MIRRISFLDVMMQEMGGYEVCRRVYKPPFPHEEAVAGIEAGAGAHFDPDMVEAFLETAEHFKAFAHKYADAE
jgi:putative two-component system response regulator